MFTRNGVLLFVIGLVTAHAGTIGTDEDGNIVAAVPDGNKILLQEGTAAAVDIVGEVKLARRDTAKNGACDSTVLAVLGDLMKANADSSAAAVSANAAAATAATAAAAAASAAASKQLAEMVNATAEHFAKAGATTNNYDMSTSSGAQLAAAAMKKQPSCWAYKVANPNLKSGVYVLSEVAADYTPTTVNGDYCNPGKDGRSNEQQNECGIPSQSTTVQHSTRTKDPEGYKSYRMNRKRPEMKVYCDMEEDGGGWTLVSHEANGIEGKYTGGALIQASPESSAYFKFSYGEARWLDGGNTVDSYGEQELRLLNPKSTLSAKMPDDYINNIRQRKNTMSSIGYRTTSNDMKQKYFHHEDCFYKHASASSDHTTSDVYQSRTHPCRRYTTKIDAVPDDWVQCMYHTHDFGGIDCWKGCNKELVRNPDRMVQTMTNVVVTSMDSTDGSSNRRSSMADNPKGEVLGALRKSHGNDVLLWVR